jgi:hypothetical protein
MFGSIARAKRYYKNDAAVYEIITLPYQCSLGHLTSGHELEGHRGYMQTATINILALGQDETPIESLSMALLRCHTPIASSANLFIHKSSGLSASVEITKFDFVVLLVDSSRSDW